MIRHSDLYSNIISRDSLFNAYLAARKGKRAKNSCDKFERRLGHHIDDLHERLSNGLYEPKKPNSFYVHEPKKRLIEAPAFADLVVQHCVYRILMPIFDRTFSASSFACRVGYGTHLACDKLQDGLRATSRDGWIVKIDCKKYFYSIDRAILKSLLERKIKCVKTVNLAMLFCVRDEDLGIPIGNLLSQMYGLIYLNEADQYIKRVLKVKNYCRYVDDLVMFAESKAEADFLHDAVKMFLLEQLHLNISKSTVTHISKGINAFGFRTWRSSRFIRKRSLYVAARALKEGRHESFISCLGHAKYTNSKQHLLRMVQERGDGRFSKIPKSLRIHYSPQAALRIS